MKTVIITSYKRYCNNFVVLFFIMERGRIEREGLFTYLKNLSRTYAQLSNVVLNFNFMKP